MESEISPASSSRKLALAKAGSTLRRRGSVLAKAGARPRVIPAKACPRENGAGNPNLTVY